MIVMPLAEGAFTYEDRALCGKRINPQE